MQLKMIMMLIIFCETHPVLISEIFLVLVKEAYSDSLDKGFMDVEIFPFFWWCDSVALKPLSFSFLFNILSCDWTISKLSEIALGHDKDDRAAWLDRLYLSLPCIDIAKWVAIVDRHAYQEHICTAILRCPIDTKLKVTACIVYLDLDLTSLYILDAFIDIEYGRFVVFGEAILEVVPDETGLTYWGIADEDHLDSFLSIIFCLLRLISFIFMLLIRIALTGDLICTLLLSCLSRALPLWCFGVQSWILTSSSLSILVLRSRRQSFIVILNAFIISFNISRSITCVLRLTNTSHFVLLFKL